SDVVDGRRTRPYGPIRVANRKSKAGETDAVRNGRKPSASLQPRRANQRDSRREPRSHRIRWVAAEDVPRCRGAGRARLLVGPGKRGLAGRNHRQRGAGDGELPDNTASGSEVGGTKRGELRERIDRYANRHCRDTILVCLNGDTLRRRRRIRRDQRERTQHDIEPDGAPSSWYPCRRIELDGCRALLPSAKRRPRRRTAGRAARDRDRRRKKGGRLDGDRNGYALPVRILNRER